MTISGSLQGPICVKRTCGIYDSGQIQITVNNFSVSTNYSRSANQRTTTQLANSLAAKLNAASSPVIARVSQSKITLTSKATGTAANYPLATAVTHSSYFSRPSFNAIASGSTLIGGTGAPTPVLHRHAATAVVEQYQRLLFCQRSRRETYFIASRFLMASIPTQIILVRRRWFRIRPLAIFPTLVFAN